MSLAESRVQVSPSTETLSDAGITSAVFSDAGLLAAALGDGAVQIIGPNGDTEIVQAHDGAALCLALDIDGRSFVTGGDDGRVVRTAADGSFAELMHAPGRQIDALAVSRPGKVRAVAVGREVRLLDATGRVRASSSDHPSTVSALAFNPKGKRLALLWQFRLAGVDEEFLTVRASPRWRPCE
jgi:WD40 repeat protein